MNTFAHQADAGDIIACLPTIRALGGGELVISFKPGPMRGRHNMKGARFEALRPLLAAQPYLSDVRWSDEWPDTPYDFGAFRSLRSPLGESLMAWQARHLGVEISSESWLSGITPRKGLSERIIVARTERYQNWNFPWPEIMKEHRDRILLVGLPEEHKSFCRLLGNVEYMPTRDFLEVAEVIAGSALLIVNQTAAGWIGLGLGHPLIQEQYPPSPDSCIPRPNAQYCATGAMPKIDPPSAQLPIPLTATKKAAKPASTVLAVFPYHEGDRAQAQSLAAFIRDLGGVESHQCLLVHPEGVSADGIEEPLREAFGSLETFTYPATLSGWPYGPNEMFAAVALMIARDSRFGDFLWLEPDCVPQGAKWLTRIGSEHRACGQPILGVVTDTVNMDTRQVIGRHTVGVAVYPKLFSQLCPLVKGVTVMSAEYARAKAMPKAFDAYFGPYTAPHTAETRLIQHFWRSKDFRCEGERIVAGFHVGAESVVSDEAALIHGCKDASLIDIMRVRIVKPKSNSTAVPTVTIANSGNGEIAKPEVSQLRGSAVEAQGAHNEGLHYEFNHPNSEDARRTEAAGDTAESGREMVFGEQVKAVRRESSVPSKNSDCATNTKDDERVRGLRADTSGVLGFSPSGVEREEIYHSEHKGGDGDSSSRGREVLGSVLKLPQDKALEGSAVVASSILAPATLTPLIYDPANVRHTQIPSGEKHHGKRIVAPALPWTIDAEGRAMPPFVKGQPEFQRHCEMVIEMCRNGFRPLRKYAKANLKIIFPFKGLSKEVLLDAIVLKEREMGKEEWTKDLMRGKKQGESNEVTCREDSPRAQAETMPAASPPSPQVSPTPQWSQVLPAENGISAEMRAKMLKLRQERGMPVTV